MNIDELLSSYDEIDRKYRARFNDSETVVYRKPDNDLFSFIPNKEELDNIFLEPISRMRLVN